MRHKIRESPTKRKSAKRVQGRFSRLLLLKERGHIIQCLRFPHQVRRKKMERLCRRPFCPMAEFALARAVPAAKLTDEMHAQGHSYFRVSADAGRPGEGAGHCCIPVGLMISDSLRTVLQCSPSRRLQSSSAGSLPLGSKSLK